MSYEYSDPEREDETYALPDIEIWEDEIATIDCRTCGTFDTPRASTDEGPYCPSCDRETEGYCATGKLAWWYWFCLPGYLPDSPPSGPFATYVEALEEAREYYN